MRFSQRQGLEPIRVELQHDSIDEDLKNSLWSAVYICFFDNSNGFFIQQLRYSRQGVESHCLWMNFFKQPLDTFPSESYPNLFKWKRNCSTRVKLTKSENHIEWTV